MQRIILFILPILMASCNTGGTRIDEQYFTIADSTQASKAIIDSMRAEMYTQWFMDTTHNKLHCYNPPDFNPELLIEIKSNGEIWVNGRINTRGISSELVVDFYSTDRINTSDNNSELYTELTKQRITTEIKKHQDELESMKSIHDGLQEMIDFKQNMLNEWKAKLDVLKILGLSKVQEPNYLAGVELKYPENCKINESVLDSILIGYYKIREEDSKKYFSESYAKIYWKAIHLKDSNALKKLDAFKLLHPVRILDFRKSRYTPLQEILPPPPVIEE